MGQAQFIAIHAVVRHQQPPRQAFFDLAAFVGEGGLRGLRRERAHVTQQYVVQWHARCDCLAKLLSRDALPIARDLHVGLVRNAVAISHDHARPGHTFASDDADGRFSIGDHRRDPAFDEVDVLDALVRGGELRTKGKIDSHQVGFEQAQVCFGQSR